MNLCSRQVSLVVALMGCAIIIVMVGGCGGARGGAGSTTGEVDTASSHTLNSGTPARPLGRQVGPPQDDDHITVYGHEAVGSERKAILRLLRRYYAAAAADDGKAACAMLHAQLARSVVEDYGQTPINKGNTCTAVMNKVFRHIAGQSPRVLAKTRVTGIRVRGGEGFAQLHSGAMATGEIAVTKDGHRWRVAVLIGRACKNCDPAGS